MLLMKSASITLSYSNAPTNSMKCGKNSVYRINSPETLLNSNDPGRVYDLNQILQQWGRSGKQRRALELLEKMESNLKNATNLVRPDPASYAIVINAYSRIGDEKMAQYVFDKINAPNIYAYNSLLSAYAKNGLIDECMSIISDLEAKKSIVGPNVISYTTVINSLNKRGRIKQAQDILDRMINIGVQPNIITYNSFLDAWARKAKFERDAAREAERLLTQMIKNESEFEGIQPDMVSYSTVVHAYSRRGEAKEAERILFKMEDAGLVHTSTHTYNAVLHAWARSKMKNAPIQAERLLLRMTQRQLNGLSKVKPDEYSLQAIIDAWAKCPEKGSAQKAEEVLNHLRSPISATKPNIYHYNSVITAWARSKEKGAPQKAESLLLEMEADYNDGFIKVKPNAVSYSCVIDAWAKSEEVQAPKHALHILERMRSLYDKGNKDVRPTIVTYNSVLNALAKHDPGDIATAELLLTHMEASYKSGEVVWESDDIAYTYSSMIHMYATLDKKMAIKKAELALHRIQGLGIKPNPLIYNLVLDVYARCCECDSGVKADSLLKQMKNERVKPDICTFNSALHCWARSPDENKATRAFSLLSYARQYYSDTDGKSLLIAYNTVLNACASSHSTHIIHYHASNDPFHIAMKVYSEIKNSPLIKPDHITYGTFLKACSNLLPIGDERINMTREIFHSCCADGQVSEAFFRAMQIAAPTDLHDELVKKGKTYSLVNTIDTIPVEWRCNVRTAKSCPEMC